MRIEKIEGYSGFMGSACGYRAYGQSIMEVVEQLLDLIFI